MAKESTKNLTVLDREFKVELVHEGGKVFAETEVEGFGRLMVADMGRGEEAALEGLRLRLVNILKEAEQEVPDAD